MVSKTKPTPALLNDSIVTTLAPTPTCFVQMPYKDSPRELARNEQNQSEGTAILASQMLSFSPLVSLSVPDMHILSPVNSGVAPQPALADEMSCASLWDRGFQRWPTVLFCGSDWQCS